MLRTQPGKSILFYLGCRDSTSDHGPYELTVYPQLNGLEFEQTPGDDEGWKSGFVIMKLQRVGRDWTRTCFFTSSGKLSNFPVILAPWADAGLCRLEGNVQRSPWVSVDWGPRLVIALALQRPRARPGSRRLRFPLCPQLKFLRFTNLKWFSHNGQWVGCWKNKGESVSETELHAEHNRRWLSASVVKNPPAKQEMKEMQVWSVGWIDPLEKEMAIQSRILAWKIPWTEEPGGRQSMRSQRVRHN